MIHFGRRKKKTLISSVFQSLTPVFKISNQSSVKSMLQTSDLGYMISLHRYGRIQSISVVISVG
jgi:hypothetical protein